MNNEIFFDGKQYISANDASALSGLTRDYVARLCREGKMSGKRIGKNWYVENASLRSFLVGQEYSKSLRRESLVRERVQEYRAADSPPSPRPPQRPAEANIVRPSRAAQQPVKYSAPTLSRSLAVSPMYGKLATAVAQAGTRVTDNAANIAASPSGVADAAIRMATQSAAHIPAYTITPLAEFFHKLTALALAFMLTFGTYALVDPQVVRVARESAQDTARSLRTAYVSVTGGGMQQLATNLQSQMALAAENPSATFAAASAAFTTSIPSAAASLARSVNSRIDSLIYAIAFPQSLAFFGGGIAGGSVAVQIAPYAAPRSGPPGDHSSSKNVLAENKTIIERTVEVQRIVAESGGITEAELNTRLEQLNNKLVSQIYSITAVGGSTPVASGGVVNMIAATNRIDQLSGAAIAGGTMAGTAISGGSISGTSVSATTLSASGDTSLSDTIVNGDVTVTGAFNLTSTTSVLSATNASTTNLTWVNATGTNATTTNFFTTLGRLTTGIVDTFTSTLATITGLNVTNSTTTNATTTNLAVTNLTSFMAPIAPYFTATSTSQASTFPYASSTAFSVSGKSFFDGGFLALASSTIGDGTQIGGLTVSGGATTTGNASVLGGTLQVKSSTAVIEAYGDNPSIRANRNGTISSFGANSGGGFIGSVANVGFNIMTNNTSRVTIASTGEVGIGTTTPYGILSISNSATTVANTPLFTIASTTGGNSTSTLMTVLANGNVGVGTSSPISLFTVQSAVNPTITVAQSGGKFAYLAAGSSGSGFNFDKSGYFAIYGAANQTDNGTQPLDYYKVFGNTGNTLIGNNSFSTADTNYKLNITAAGSAGYFAISNSSTGDTFNVNSSGNIGIGNASPTYNLDVTGNAHVSSFLDASYLVATSSSATSTLAGGFAVGSNYFNILQNGRIGIGTAAPTVGFDVGVATKISGDLTVSGGSALTISATGPVNQTGTGQVTFAGNVDATNGLDVTTGNFTVGGSNFLVAPGTGNTTVAGTFGLTGALAASSTFQLTGAARLYSSLQADGALTAAAAGTGLSVTNNASVGGTFSLSGAGTFGSTLAVAGLLTAATTTFTGDVALSGKKITGLGSPSSDQDAANKVYVDSVAQGLSLKDSVRAGTTANITISGEQTIDGVSLVVGNRVLVKDQTDQTKNGIYVVASGAWSRSTDADANSEVSSGMFTFITEGTLNANSGWVLTTTGAITLGTSLLTFTQFSGAGQITAGTGITKSGNTLDVVGTTDRITANADTIDIASTYVGQTSISTVGTLTSGSLGVGFGNINIGASSITGGVATFSSIVGSAINGTGDLTISGSGTFSNGLSVVGTLTAATTTFSGDVALGGKKITGLANPTAAQEAATKAYVDAIAQGLTVKASVRVATSSNITLSGTQTIDGVSAVAGDRVLVMGQSTASQNGIYVVAAGAWSRSTDADENSEVVQGMYAFVSAGTAYANTGWSLITANPITLGTTALTFTQFSGSAETTAGDGLTKSGNTINAVGTADRITVTADAINIAATYTGQGSIVTVGSLTSGSIGSGFGAINIGTSALTAGAATFTTANSIGTLSIGGTATTSIVGNNATSTFSGGLSLASGNVNLATGGSFLINNALALNATTLGSSVLASSLTSVGGLDSGSITTGFGAINIGADTLDAGASTLASLTVSGNTTLANATSTYLFSTTASSTNLYSTNANLGALSAGTLNLTSTLNVTGLSTFSNGLLSLASSTIGDGTQTGGLTVSGGATTTGNAYFAGNVGIGTASPAAKLQVTGGHILLDNAYYVEGKNSGGGIRNIFGTDANNYTVVGSADGGIRFQNGAQSATLMTILNAGNVGIGTTSPYSLLSLSNNLNTAANTPLFTIASTTGGNSTTTLMTVLASGNVGIGTTTPNTNLNIYSANSPILALDGGNASGLQWIQFNENSATKAFIKYRGTTNTPANQLQIGTNSSGGTLALQSGSASTGLFLDSTGNVGIGTTTPSYKLDVAGFINTDQYSGYKQAGNTVLYASTTNSSLAVGASGAAGWMSASSTILQNVAVGIGALATTPTSGVAINNTAVGYNSLNKNTVGLSNSAYGSSALITNSTGSYNTSQGAFSLGLNNTGSQNTAVGYASLYSLAGTFSNNTALGNSAGRYQADGTTALTSTSQSVYIGSGAMGFNNSDSNSIVIGYLAKGIGANSVVLGNDSITTTALKGNIGIGTTTPSQKLDVFVGSSNGDGISLRGTSDNVQLRLENQGTNGQAWFLNSAGGASGQGPQGSLIFSNGAPVTGAFGTARMTITSSGNVGIGTTSPYKTLSIGGDVVVGAATVGGTLGNLYIPTLGTAAGTFIAADPTGKLVATTTPSGASLTGTTGQLAYFSGTNTAVGTSTLFISTAGNVGIGTTTPWARLSVKGVDTLSTSMAFQVTDSSDASLFSVDDSGTTTIGNSLGTGDAVFQYAADANAWAVGYRSSDKAFVIASSTNFSGTAALAIAKNGNATFSGSGGTCTINGSGSCTSDLRLKTDIATTTGADALAKLASIDTVTYTWADPSLDQNQRIGVIAQQVMGAFPQLVGSTTVTFNGVSGDYYTVNYAGLTAPLIAAVNELNARQQAEFDALVGTSTASSTTSQAFAAGFFSNLFAKLIEWFASAANGIGDLFAGKVHTKEICVAKADGTEFCADGDRLAEMAAAGSSGGGGGSALPSTPSPTTPVISVNGANPATIDSGTTYVDLGAIITGPADALNLGISVSVDGGATTTIGAIFIDTTAAGTHTIVYSATDQDGLTGYATRTVDVVEPMIENVSQSSETSSTTNTDTTTGSTGSTDSTSSPQATSEPATEPAPDTATPTTP